MGSRISAVLAGASVLITRPVGHGQALAARVRACGGEARLLPGVALRPAVDAVAATAALRAALAGDVVVFTSPAAVQFAARLAPLRGRACIATVGRGTAAALARHGVRDVWLPATTQDSEGLLAHPHLRRLRDRRVAVVGAPGGRGVLQREIAARGARLSRVHVYCRVPARLDARHARILASLQGVAYTLLSSAETLRCLQQALDAESRARLLATHAVVSSERIQRLAGQAGFCRVSVAASALSADLLGKTVQLHASTG